MLKANSSFFELFKLHVDSTKTLNTKYYEDSWEVTTDLYLDRGAEYHGKDYFKVMRQKLINGAYAKYKSKGDGNPSLSLEEVVQLYYDQIFSINDSEMGYYFRNMYSIFKYISNSPLDTSEKDSYFDIMRAQLSEDEAFIMHYNLEHPLGKKFKEILARENYNLLKHIQSKDFI